EAVHDAGLEVEAAYAAPLSARAWSSDGTVIKDRRDGRASQRSFETGSITEVLRRRTVVDVLRRAVGTPSQLERGESSISLGATRYEAESTALRLRRTLFAPSSPTPPDGQDARTTAEPIQAGSGCACHVQADH